MAIKSHLEQPKQLGHLMLDLETMGNKSKSAIVSIGAVEFDIETGRVGRKFYRHIDLQSSINMGLIVNGDTIEWWLKQSDAAREAITNEKDKVSLAQALHDFGGFLIEIGADTVQIWGNGARFDMGILEDAYDAWVVKTPWNFRLERDVRTLVSLAPEIKDNYPSAGIIHNPIHDCLFQIGYCSAIWQHIMKGSNNG